MVVRIPRFSVKEGTLFYTKLILCDSVWFGVCGVCKGARIEDGRLRRA